MDNKFKVIDENNNELEEENADICVSLLEKDSNNYPIFKDINDSKEKEEIDKVVKEIIEQIK